MANFAPCNRPCFIPWNLTIPTAFSESYSYAEMVCYLFEMIKKLENEFNTNNDTILNYVDEQINNLKTYTENLVSELRAEEKEDVENLSNYFIEKLTDLKTYVDEKDNITYFNAIAYFNTMVDNQPPYLVRNPVTNMPDTLQNTLNSLYETIRWFSLTASEYDNLAISAFEYDGKYISAQKYDLFSKCIFWYNFYTVYSAFTGEKVTHQQALNEITQILRTEGITAKNYDDIGMTSDEFNGFEIDTYDYDWHGNAILTL